MPEFTTFLRFDNIEKAETTAGIFRSAGIEVLVEKLSVPNDIELGSAPTSYHTTIGLKIAKADFVKGRELLIKENISSIENKNHMLPFFTDEELRDVVAMPEQWGLYNYYTAHALLKRRESK